MKITDTPALIVAYNTPVNIPVADQQTLIYKFLAYCSLNGVVLHSLHSMTWKNDIHLDIMVEEFLVDQLPNTK